MKMRSLFPNTLEVLQKTLDLRQERHNVLTSNIANAETPGYIAKNVYFEDALREAAKPNAQNPMWRTHARHLPGPTPTIHEVQGTLAASPSDDVGNDLNTVSLDQEMSRLTINTFYYNASTEIMRRMFSQLRRTISEGGQ
jgi:flagellar basal-body rod protein FlgB